MNNKELKISFIGLGKLGYPLAASLASKGYQVVGVDVDKATIKAVNSGTAPIYEPGLTELMATTKGRLTATDDGAKAVAETDITFLVVPTPSEPTGEFSLKYVLQACRKVADGLQAKSKYHTVVLTSTVMPGSLEGEVVPTLERMSGKSCGVDFGICYNPVFVALGSVIRDFLNPDFVLLGESDAKAGNALQSVYESICERKPPFLRMNFINAELAKLAINTFVTTKITFSNMLARICEGLPGADVDVVTSTLQMEGRIGQGFLKGAIGYGGPCFPRDNVAISRLAHQVGAQAVIAETTDRVNHDSISWLAELVKSKLAGSGTVGILGLSYKPDTDVVEQSPGLLLAQTLAEEGISVVAYDPAAMHNAGSTLGESVRLANRMEACIQDADVVIITTAWEEFRNLNPDLFCRSKQRALIDCWRILDRDRFSAVADYTVLGIGPSHSPFSGDGRTQ